MRDDARRVRRARRRHVSRRLAIACPERSATAAGRGRLRGRRERDRRRPRRGDDARRHLSAQLRRRRRPVRRRAARGREQRRGQRERPGRARGRRGRAAPARPLHARDGTRSGHRPGRRRRLGRAARARRGAPVGGGIRRGDPRGGGRVRDAAHARTARAESPAMAAATGRGRASGARPHAPRDRDARPARALRGRDRGASSPPGLQATRQPHRRARPRRLRARADRPADRPLPRSTTCFTAPPNSSGVLLLQALAALDRAAADPTPGTLARLLRAGMAQRAATLADPRTRPFDRDAWLGEERLDALARTPPMRNRNRARPATPSRSSPPTTAASPSA